MSGLHLAASLSEARRTSTASSPPHPATNLYSSYAITIDAATEERIQRQLNRGAFPGHTELLAHALDIIEAEAPYENWLLRNKEVIQAAIERSSAPATRGEGFSPEECRALLAQHRATSDLNRLV